MLPLTLYEIEIERKRYKVNDNYYTSLYYISFNPSLNLGIKTLPDEYPKARIPFQTAIQVGDR